MKFKINKGYRIFVCVVVFVQRSILCKAAGDSAYLQLKNAIIYSLR